jgi:hypothetical protein
MPVIATVSMCGAPAAVANSEGGHRCTDFVSTLRRNFEKRAEPGSVGEVKNYMQRSIEISSDNDFNRLYC